MPGCPTPDGPMPGSPTAGNRAPDSPAPGGPTPSGLTAGRPVPGRQVPGRPAVGCPVPDGPAAGWQAPDGPTAGDRMPGDPVPGGRRGASRWDLDRARRQPGRRPVRPMIVTMVPTRRMSAARAVPRRSRRVVVPSAPALPRARRTGPGRSGPGIRSVSPWPRGWAAPAADACVPLPVIGHGRITFPHTGADCLITRTSPGTVSLSRRSGPVLEVV